MTDTSTHERDVLITELHETMFRLLRAQRQLAERAFSPLGLRPVHAFALALVGHDATYPKDLAQLMDAPPSAVSALIGDLEDRELLTRALDPGDRRRVRIELTDAGRRTLEAVQRAWTDTTTETVARLSTADLEALVRIQKALLEE